MEKKKILVIDDEADVVNLVKFRLEFQDYYVIPLYTSIRSLEIAKRERPDLILLDVMMPDKDGYDVCKELRSDEATKNIPIILFTAKQDQKNELKKGAETVGADDHILKPFDMAELFSKIKDLIN